MFGEAWGKLRRLSPGEKREVKPSADQENPVVIARDSLGNPVGTAKSSLEADRMEAQADEETRLAA
ncbi:MAG: hypothetical protein ACM3TU_03455 [Bacillota bacterium]